MDAEAYRASSRESWEAAAKGWAVATDDVICDRCVARPDVDTVYQDSAPDWGRR